MSVLGAVLGVLFVAVGIGASIALHELGHFLPAKRFGIRIPQYMIGFGPAVWSRKTEETEYGVKAIPLGGYVRMIGMYPPRPGDDPGTVRVSSTGRFSGLVDEARAAAQEELQPGDDHRVFYKLPVRKKLVVMLGGPVMNLLIAVLLLTFLLTAHGVATQQPGATVASVAECVMPYTEAQTATDCGSAPKTPAAQAGLLPGDEFVSINGEPIEDNAAIGRAIRPRIGQPTAIVVRRDGKTLDLTATPIRNTLPVIGSDGRIVRNADGSVKTTEAGFLGVTSSNNFAVVRQPVSAVPGFIGSSLVATAKGLGQVPSKMVGITKTIFGGAEREADSPMSVVGVGRIAGEVSSGALDGLIGSTFADRFFFLVSLLASLNLMLFGFNLIPLLPLDGGQVAGALWEGLKRGWARLRGRPDPGYVDVAKALPLAYAMSMVIIVMSVLLMYADIVDPIKLGG